MKLLLLIILLYLGTLVHMVRIEGALSQIRSRKKCPRGFVLRFDRLSKKYECRCKQFHHFWPADGKCYREYLRGPCPQGHRLELHPLLKIPTCACPFFSAKFSDGKCYQEHTQGPCPEGLIIQIEDSNHSNHRQQQASCSCNITMKMNYFQENNKCYELYTRGPCREGHIVFFDYSRSQPSCRCKDKHHLHTDGKCYPINTPGPCNSILADSCASGTPCLIKTLEKGKIECTCLPPNSTTKDGKCFEPLRRGPCQFGEWLVFHKNGDATCETKQYCKRFDNWHWWPPHQRCYRQFSQGPCHTGQLFYLDPAVRATGCHCKSEWKNHFYPPTNKCYEQDTRGPCPPGHYFTYNTEIDSTECRCFKNFVLNPSNGSCVELFTRGPCPDGELVIKSTPNEEFMSCRCNSQMKQHYWQGDGKCYPHYQQGPCSEGQQFRLGNNNDTNGTETPSCVKWG